MASNKVRPTLAKRTFLAEPSCYAMALLSILVAANEEMGCSVGSDSICKGNARNQECRSCARLAAVCRKSLPLDPTCYIFHPVADADRQHDNLLANEL